ncbi:FK506-binding protein 15 isoform X2 [Ascaphus truei]|uniref:FK506-binding protein 15 isoform X2 n=1 Tax=Ascaphus truei TaxID=8439 RepID=UPI003F5A17E9
MFGADDDDLDFLSPAGGAKLASLFGLDQAVAGQGNESFQYTAPKQPKKGQGSAGPKAPKPSGAAGSAPAPSVLFATAVHAYRYVNGQFVKQGKFGAAVLGNHTAKKYKILLYLNQQQQVTAARIHPGFIFTVQLNNYAAFYDDQRQSWSVMFESEVAASDFSKQVCIAKCNSSPSLDAVLCQDLLPGDGQAADVGDSLEVAYTGWLFQNQGLGQVFDSNVQKDKLLRLKLGTGKVIKGWEEGMLGMMKGGRRLLVIPPALGYGSQGVVDRIPPNATLVFEVEVKRMKLKDLGSDRQSIGSRDSPVSITDSLPPESLSQPPSTVPPKPGEPAVRTKSNSISEQLANPDVAKAKLISRMAKMGKPMLPFLAGSSTPQPDSSDSEIEDPNTQRVPPHPLPVRPTPQLHAPAPVSPNLPVSGLQASSAALLPAGPIQTAGTCAAFQPYTGIQYAYPHNPAPSTQLQPVGHMYPAQFQHPAHFQASGDVTSFLMTEARQHSTEIRMAVSKVADKIDLLASKVDHIQKENTGPSHLLPGISSITMESAMIMNNIQRIIQENERLKQEVLEKSGRIEEQNVKIGELINRNQRYVEQSNLLMEQRNDSLQSTTENTQARVLHAVQEKAKVSEELAAATGQVSRLQLELAAYQKKEMELRTQLTTALQEADRHRTQHSALHVQLIELQETSEQSKSCAKTEKQSRRQLEVRMATLEEEVLDLKAEKQNLEKSLSERKKRSRQEQQRAEEEQDELRRSHQEEKESLQQLLKKTRVSMDQAATEQVSATRGLDEQKLSELQEQAEQLQPLREKYAALQSQVAALVEQQNTRTSEEEDRAPAGDTTEEVKKIMNGVFQSLRGEFDLEETYSGRAVLGTIVSTIKATTLQLLNKQQAEETPESSSSEEEDEEDEAIILSGGGFEVAGTAKRSRDASVSPSDELQQGTPVVEEAAAVSIQEENPAKWEENNDVVSDDQVEDENFHNQPTTTMLVEEDSLPQVAIIQEDLDTPSALLHMVSSDMAESSTVILVNESYSENKGDLTQEEGTGSPAKIRTAHIEVKPLVHGMSSETMTDTGDHSVGDGEPVSTTISEAEEDFEKGKREAPPHLGSVEDSRSSIPSTEDTSTESVLEIPATKTEKGFSNRAKSKQEQRNKVSLEDNEEDIFKNASPKPLKPKSEEEEEEVSMKGHPPPAPLFGDDEDEDDLDWLG